MGKFWTLWLLSVILRVMGVFAFVVTLITSCAALAVPYAGFFWLVSGLIGSLAVYAAGQFIILMISIHDSSRAIDGLLRIRRSTGQTTTPKNNIAPTTSSFAPTGHPDWRPHNHPQASSGAVELRRFRRRQDIEGERAFDDIQSHIPLPRRPLTAAEIARAVQRQEVLRAKQKRDGKL